MVQKIFFEVGELERLLHTVKVQCCIGDLVFSDNCANECFKRIGLQHLPISARDLGALTRAD